jgi:hypothetical protein
MAAQGSRPRLRSLHWFATPGLLMMLVPLP